jgi:DNA-binding FrmR family transcriptional regulator
MSKVVVHEHHGEVVKRLKRAHGHLETVITMIEQNRGCLDLAQQLHAVEKAIANAKKVLIHDHIDHCLENSVSAHGRSASDSIREFKEITKYL